MSDKKQIKNATQGYTIALNDIWSTEVVIKDYELNGNSYKGSYRVTLWDHFGLDAPILMPAKWQLTGPDSGPGLSFSISGDINHL